MGNRISFCGGEIIATALYLSFFLFLLFCFNDIRTLLLVSVSYMRSQCIVLTWLDAKRDLRLFPTFTALFAFGNPVSPSYYPSYLFITQCDER